MTEQLVHLHAIKTLSEINPDKGGNFVLIVERTDGTKSMVWSNKAEDARKLLAHGTEQMEQMER